MKTFVTRAAMAALLMAGGIGTFAAPAAARAFSSKSDRTASVRCRAMTATIGVIAIAIVTGATAATVTAGRKNGCSPRQPCAPHAPKACAIPRSLA